MTRKEIEARIQFEDVIVREFVAAKIGRDAISIPCGEARRIAKLICRHAKSYSRIQEAICNGVEWSQYDTNETFNKRQATHEKWTEKRDAQLEDLIKRTVEGLGPGFGVVFGGDPRGCTVKITVPSGFTNDWGKEGVCVPTA